METLWLLTVALVPVLFAPQDFMMFFDVPKIAILRILTGLMALLWIAEWALKSRAEMQGMFNPRALAGSFNAWLSRGSANWVILAATLFLVIYILSTLLNLNIAVIKPSATFESHEPVLFYVISAY